MLQAFLFALLAALGNAVFVFGQKKAATSHSLGFIALATATSMVCLLLLAASQHELTQGLRGNARWAVVSGIGLAVTYMGFYLLYSRFGASYYVLYAILSMISTAILVGVVIFHEPFTRWHWLSLILAVGSVASFTIGQQQ
ncbi:Uncharacterised protein [BD1-7 clade bacterium]|uniref:4-amino-4-deoxy-L-arabinose-phosphoundecaprenol flippase subunit ArnE n=1 Tax=BD1-7 clade bacterium TaxID=2029982 RepID=A0A5S9N3H6_9GAMM|nr:Uncharacterised protein [BD1-7 clade bacterium]CAA0082455.1 Uncharacterised protein [BD1-7 clade bacterium]